MQVSIDNSDQHFLARLNRLGDCTVQELCADLGVTATAVRQRMSRLLSADFVERDKVPAERGRPYHVYRVTPTGRRQLGDDYGELAPLLWREMQRIDDDSVRQQLWARLREALVARYGASIPESSLTEKFHHLQQALDDQGFQVDCDQLERGDGLLPVLREHSCPYHELASSDSSICDLEQSVFSEVLGVPLELTQCCRDGDSCCQFEPVLS